MSVLDNTEPRTSGDPIPRYTLWDAAILTGAVLVVVGCAVLVAYLIAEGRF